MNLIWKLQAFYLGSHTKKNNLDVKQFELHRNTPPPKNSWNPFTGERLSDQVKSLSRVRLFATPWTVAYHTPSMGVSRQEYWSGLPFPSRGFSQPRDQTRVSCIVGRFFTVWATCGHERNCTTWLGSTSKDVAVKPTRRSHMSVNKGHLKRPGKAKAKSRDVVQGV